jgi:hypothetical protein
VVQRVVEMMYRASSYDTRDRELLVSAHRQAKESGGLPFHDFLIVTEQGQRLHAEWVGWLNSCQCPCGPTDEPEHYIDRCGVHGLVAAAETLLEITTDDFEPEWKARAKDRYWGYLHPEHVRGWISQRVGRFLLPPYEQIDRWFPEGLNDE